MLRELDDTLWHQLPTTFDHVGTSDPRFFDRYWFAVYEPDGRAAVQYTLGVYNNMNVVDGGFVVVHEGTQHNLRVSRALRPRFEPACGPLRVEVVQPFERFRLVVEPGDHPVSGVLDWVAALEPEEEKPHFERVRGRVTQDYQRFDQVGEVAGFLDVRGRRIDVERWWGCRDHSWGVRPAMGVPEPVTGPAPDPSREGTLFAFLFFSTETVAGHVQVMERGARRVYLTGLLRDRRTDTPRTRSVSTAELALVLREGTRRASRLDIDVGLDDGGALQLHADALGPSIAMPGLGYSGGWNDGLGLGVWRGESHVEVDEWDVRDAVEVLRADGTVLRPVHRIQPVHVTAAGPDGDSEGTGSLTIIVTGALPQYGLDG